MLAVALALAAVAESAIASAVAEVVELLTVHVYASVASSRSKE